MTDVGRKEWVRRQVEASPPLMNDVEVLRIAADLIDRVGLHKGGYWPGRSGTAGRYTPGDPVCGVGAIAVVLKIDPIAGCFSEAAIALNNFLDENANEDIVSFNDHPETTAELMAKTMRVCADELEAA